MFVPCYISEFGIVSQLLGLLPLHTNYCARYDYQMIVQVQVIYPDRFGTTKSVDGLSVASTHELTVPGCWKRIRSQWNLLDATSFHISHSPLNSVRQAFVSICFRDSIVTEDPVRAKDIVNEILKREDLQNPSAFVMKASDMLYVFFSDSMSACLYREQPEHVCISYYTHTQVHNSTYTVYI